MGIIINLCRAIMRRQKQKKKKKKKKGKEERVNRKAEKTQKLAEGNTKLALLKQGHEEPMG